MRRLPVQSRRWPIPQTRLPFTNQDVTPIDFRGEPGLVSSIWGGRQGGRIYLWNPDTHEAAEIRLPGGTMGAYMLRTAPDGRLYLGGGGGELMRLDPRTECIETLVTGKLQGITWGGCATVQFVIWSTKPGEVGAYDWRNDRLVKVIRSIDSESPPAMYAHSFTLAPDGRIVIGLNTPQARLIVLDPLNLTARSFTPDALRGYGMTAGLAFLNPNTLCLTACGRPARCMLLRYPGFELIRSFNPPPGARTLGRHGCVLDGRLYACAEPSGDLCVLDEDAPAWRCVCESFDGGEGGFVSAVAAHDGRLLCGVTIAGSAVSFDPRTGRRDAFDLPATGHCEARALCPVPEVGRVFGAPFITGRFWSLNIETGEGIDHGRGMRGGGQIDFAVWDPAQSLVYMSSYHETNLSTLDPWKPIGWPHNPRFLASAYDHDQMRDKALAFDGTRLWMPTAADYGLLGGALCRIDPVTAQIDVRRHIVPDQTPNSVIVGADGIYCATEVHADGGSAPPTQSHARLIRVDSRTMAITAETTIADADRLFALAMVGDRLLAQSPGRFYLWDACRGDVTDLGPAPRIFVNAVVTDDAGVLWASDVNTTGRILIGASLARYEPVLDCGSRYLQRDRRGLLWLATDDHVVAFDPVNA